MASKQTTHYQLSQWEATDAVVRRDFNDDNAKIDAAIHSKAEGAALTALAGTVAQNAEKESADVAALRSENQVVRLTEWTVGSAAAQVNFDVSPYVTGYRKLYLVCNLQTSSGADFYCHFNNDSSENYLSDSGDTTYTHGKIGTSASKFYAGTIALCPAGPEQYIVVSAQGYSRSEINHAYDHIYHFSHKTLTFPRLKTLQLDLKSGDFVVGSQFVLYGLKE